jgi:hypothetical protein
MHNWFTVWNPQTKEACDIFVVGSAIDGFLDKDVELIRAFFKKNCGYVMKISDTDDLIDEIYDSGGIILNKLSELAKKQYIEDVL